MPVPVAEVFSAFECALCRTTDPIWTSSNHSDYLFSSPGRLTCRALVDQYLRRIDAYDKNGPAINSIVLVNPEAEKEADELHSSVKTMLGESRITITAGGLAMQDAAGRRISASVFARARR